MLPMNRKSLAIAVEYDGPAGTRVTRLFPSAPAARRFFAAKAAAGAAPRVVVPEATKKETFTMANTTTTKAAKTTKAAAGSNGHAPRDPATAEIRWTGKKLALLALLKKMGATSVRGAVTVARVKEAAGDGVLTNIHPAFDMTVQGYLDWADPNEGERAHRVYVTKKGLAVKAPAANGKK